jgi:hypothetical protein
MTVTMGKASSPEPSEPEPAGAAAAAGAAAETAAVSADAAAETDADVEADAVPEQEPAPALRDRARRLLAPVATVAAGTGLIALHGTRYGHWLIDDAAISGAYARSFTEGWGPVAQRGAEQVEGFSNPTWTALLALGRLVGLYDRGTIFGVPDYVLFPKAVGLLLCAGILALGYVAAARVTTRPWLVTLVFGGLLALNPSFVIWIFSGLENPLYALVIMTMAVLVFLAVLDDRLLTSRLAITLGALAAVAALTRPEGLIYAGVYPLVVLGRLRRSTLDASIRCAALSVGTFAAPVGAYFVWRYATFGQWLASPSLAKNQGLPGLSDFTRPGELVDYAGALAVLAAVVLLGMVLSRPFGWRRGLLALLVPLGLAVVAFAVLEEDWMSQFRFATPIWVLGSLVAVLVAAEVLRQAPSRGRVWIAAALAVVLLPSAASLADASDTFRGDPDISACYVADRFGRIFNGYADVLELDEASLLIPDLGGSSMTSRLELIDMAGLTSDRFAELVHDHDRQGQMDYVYEELEPTFVHSRLPWSDGNGIGWDPRLERDYLPIHFDIYQGPPHGDWVRKDAVTNQRALAEVREYAAEHTAAVERFGAGWRRQSCGDTLHRGQTVTDRS